MSLFESLTKYPLITNTIIRRALEEGDKEMSRRLYHLLSSASSRDEGGKINWYQNKNSGALLLALVKNQQQCILDILIRYVLLGSIQ